jgi:hypothetical protein
MTVAIRIEAVHDSASVQPVIDRWLGSLDGGPAAVLFEAALKIHRWLRPMSAAIEAVELALGCLCCTGALALRVTLVRIAQRLNPTGLLLSPAPSTLRVCRGCWSDPGNWGTA